jgi:hypothetical protein
MEPLLAVGQKFVFERLKALHGANFTWVRVKQEPTEVTMGEVAHA